MGRVKLLSTLGVFCLAGFITGHSIAQDCVGGACTNPCATWDGNFLGSKISDTCSQCVQGCDGIDSQGNPICYSGYKRTETCRSCPAGSEGSATQCQNQTTCEDHTITSLCLRSC